MKKKKLPAAILLLVLSLLTSCGPSTVNYLDTPDVKASSQWGLDKKPWLFDPYYLLDGNKSTAWCEGNPENGGKGDTITMQFAKVVKFDHLKVVNGWAKDSSKLNNNWQVRKIKLQAFYSKDNTDGGSVELDLPKGTGKQDILSTGKVLYADKVVITLLDFHRIENDKYKDTCLSEIGFLLDKKELFVHPKDYAQKVINKNKEAKAASNLKKIENELGIKFPFIFSGQELNKTDCPARAVFREDGDIGMVGVIAAGTFMSGAWKYKNKKLYYKIEVNDPDEITGTDIPEVKSWNKWTVEANITGISGGKLELDSGELCSYETGEF
jgi:hypothetical protein